MIRCVHLAAQNNSNPRSPISLQGSPSSLLSGASVRVGVEELAARSAGLRIHEKRGERKHTVRVISRWRPEGIMTGSCRTSRKNRSESSSGDESAIKGLIKALLKIESKTEGGKINFGFGLALGVAFILALAGSALHEVASLILALFHEESKQI